jgi:hypothetical protein
VLQRRPPVKTCPKASFDILLTTSALSGITLQHNMGKRFAKLAGSGRAMGVFAALFLAMAALAGLSIQSVYREAQVRKRFIADTHRSISELVSARLDTAMLDADRSLAAAIRGDEIRVDNLLKKIRQIESAQPWLAPVVVAFTASSNPDQPPAAVPQFQELIAEAERAEFQRNVPLEASHLYAKAFSAAMTSRDRSAALNREARSEMKAGATARAAMTYAKLAGEADTFDREQLRLALIAEERLVECYRLLGNEGEAAKASEAFYDFLIDRRFLANPDTYDFYRKQLPFAAAHREQQLDSIAGRFETGEMRAIPIVNDGARVVHFWTASNVRGILDRLLAEPGPWSEVSINLIDAGGHWRVSVVPKTGSVDELASHEVLRFALLLSLVFATVVAAMFLAVRSVSRELALSRMRSDFVASVSHELKTPLSLIRMFAESLREGWVSEQKRPEYYEVITRESERLTSLINNVLDFPPTESTSHMT